MQKRGAIKWWITIIVIVAFIAGIVATAIYRNSTDSAPTPSSTSAATKITKSTPLKDKIKIYFNKALNFTGTDDAYSWLGTKTKSLLGFERGFWKSFEDLGIGLLAGVWICLAYRLGWWTGSKREKVRIRRSWLELIGSSFWKIVPIGVFYFVLHQIPIIKTVVNIITLEFLITFKDTLPYALSRSLLFAFVLGLLPALIENYTRYKLQNKYRDALLRQKARNAATDQLLAPR